jgi:2-methylcitrate dehydratase
LPYIFARALVDGAITVGSFEPDAYLDPALRSLMARIAVREDPAISALFPSRILMRVEAVTTEGQRIRIEITDPRGDSTNPMDDAEIAAKFRALAEPCLGAGRAEAVLAAWGSIEVHDTMSGAMDLLADLRAG